MTDYTHIPVMYRDGANYKSYGTIVLEGVLTRGERETLKSYLRESFGVPQFKPEVLGMEHHAYGEGGWNDDYDHPWHDLLVDEAEIVHGPDCFGKYIERPGTVRDFIRRVYTAHENNWEES